MISNAYAEKLHSVPVAEPAVLSLYLLVPLDPAELRGLPARARDLMAAAGVSDADRGAVLGAVTARGRDWLGRTVAIFACSKLGLFEALPLPCVLPERAVVAARPQIRPLLAALRQYPDYLVAMTGRRYARVLWVSGDRVETVIRQASTSPRSPGASGWCALRVRHVHQRIMELNRGHYRDAAAALGQAAAGRHLPVVIGGHDDSVAGLLRALPPAVREDFAGSFAADPDTLTTAQVRVLASWVIADWVARRDQALTHEILGQDPGRPAVAGLRGSLAAVNQGAVAHLLVSAEAAVPGYVCCRCGALGTASDECPDWGTAVRAVPDLLEEMVQRTLDDAGQVTVLRQVPAGVAARLRVPSERPWRRVTSARSWMPG